LKDPELAQLHAATVQHHRDTIARLRDAHLQSQILKQIKELHFRKLERESAA